MWVAFPCEYVIRIRVAAAPREYRSRAACHFIMFVSQSIEHIVAPFTGAAMAKGSGAQQMTRTNIS